MHQLLVTRTWRQRPNCCQSNAVCRVDDVCGMSHAMLTLLLPMLPFLLLYAVLHAATKSEVVAIAVSRSHSPPCVFMLQFVSQS